MATDKQAPPPVAKKSLQALALDAMKQAVGAAMGPRQKRILETEAPGDVQAFVTNYKPAQGADHPAEIQIDRDKLMDYLKFDGGLFAGSAGGSSPRACVRVHSEKGCAACKRLAPAIETALSQRFEKRGFAPQAAPLIAVDGGGDAESTATGDSAFEDFSARATEAHCDATLYGELLPERSADADDESEDIRVTWNAYLSVKDATGIKIKAKAQSAGAVGREDPGEPQTKLEAQLLTNRAMADLYAQAASDAGAAGTGGTPAQLGQGTEEHYVRLTGITNFATYAKFKEVAQAAAGTVRLEERLLTPGEVDFAVPENVDLEKLGRTLKAAAWAGQNLQVIGSSATEIEVSLR